jgi:3-phosphoshikimate 1-carboxyvinyltransferase
LIDVGMAGTTCRFMTAFLAIQSGRKTILTGHQRLLERPIGPLVEALRELGASITYKNKEGFLPLEIEGKSMQGGHVCISASISSQFISALMLVGSSFENGLKLELEGKILSRPYIQMTMDLINQFGGICKWVSDTVIEILPSDLKVEKGLFKVESDWSSAAYWYQWVAMSEVGSRLTLRSFFEQSTQADSMAISLFKGFGVSSTFEKGSLILEKVKQKSTSELKEIDCQGFPDLAMSLAVQAIVTDSPTRLVGLDNLPLKESNRLEALKAELEKFGAEITIENNNALLIQPVKIWSKNVGPIKTYHDHRMALAIAPLSLKLDELSIEDPEVVSKSYPNYWEDVAQITK